jgi:hypothetical protein
MKLDLEDELGDQNRQLIALHAANAQLWAQNGIYALVPCQPGIDKFLGLLSNPGGVHQDTGMESDHEQEVHCTIVG